MLFIFDYLFTYYILCIMYLFIYLFIYLIFFVYFVDLVIYLCYRQILMKKLTITDVIYYNLLRKQKLTGKHVWHLDILNLTFSSQAERAVENFSNDLKVVAWYLIKVQILFRACMLGSARNRHFEVAAVLFQLSRSDIATERTAACNLILLHYMHLYHQHVFLWLTASCVMMLW